LFGSDFSFEILKKYGHLSKNIGVELSFPPYLFIHER